MGSCTGGHNASRPQTKTFLVHLKEVRKPTQPRLRFDLEKLKDPDVACTFQVTIGGKFAPFIGLRDGAVDTDTMITIYNIAERYLGKNVTGKSLRSLKMFSTSVMTGET